MFWRGFEKHLVESLTCSWATSPGPALAPLGQWFKLSLSLQGDVRTGCGNRWCEARTSLPSSSWGSRGHHTLPSRVMGCRILLCPNSWAPRVLALGVSRAGRGGGGSRLGCAEASPLAGTKVLLWRCSGQDVLVAARVLHTSLPWQGTPAQMKQHVLLSLGLLVTGTTLPWSRALGLGGNVG